MKWTRRRIAGVAVGLVAFVTIWPRLKAEYYFLRIQADVDRAGESFDELAALGSAGRPVLHRLLHDPQWLKREFAAEALGSWLQRSPESAPLLIAVARDDPDKRPRHAALQALGGIGDTRALPLLKELAPGNTLAISGLANMGEGGKAALIELVRDEAGRPPFRAWALKTLCLTRQLWKLPETREAIDFGLKDRPWEMRSQAVECIAKLDGKEGINVIEPLLGDPAPRVRIAAVVQLASLGSKGHGAVLLSIARDRSVEQSVRGDAARALGSTGECEWQDTLQQLSWDPNGYVRDGAGSALGALSRPCGPAKATDRDVALQIQRLKGDYAPVARDAAYRLGDYGALAVGAIPALIEALKSGDVDMRQTVASSLGRIGASGADRSVPALLALLEDPETKVREAAIVALGNLGAAASAAIPALKKLGEDRALVSAVRYALRNIEGKS